MGAKDGRDFRSQVESLIVGYMSDCDPYPDEESLVQYVLDSLGPVSPEQEEEANRIIGRYV